MIKQKDAVFSAVTSSMKSAGMSFSEGTPVTLTKEVRAAVVGILVSGFEKGEIELESKQENIKSYCNGLLNNWLRKDPRLNGGSKYTPKAPGSRAGQGDPAIKEMRKLLRTNAGNDDACSKIQAEIDRRQAEIKATKAVKSVSIDIEKLPESLRGLVK